MSDLVKVNTNRFGKMVWRKPLGVNALLSQVAFGLPQNVAVMFGEKRDGFGCAVMATADLARNTLPAKRFLFLIAAAERYFRKN